MARTKISKRLGWGGSFQPDLYVIIKSLVNSFKEYMDANASTVTDESLASSPDLKTFSFSNDNVVAGTTSFKAGTRERTVLTVTAGATSDGNITVKVSDLVSVTVAVTADDDTPAKVAAKVAGATYAGYIATVSGDTVTFTAITVGNKNTGTAALSGGTTGVTGTFVTTVQGEALAAVNASDIDSIEYAYANDKTVAQVVFKTTKDVVTSTYKHVANMPTSFPEFVD